MGAAYFHNHIDGDIFAEIKPRIRERVILGVKITLSYLHQTIRVILGVKITLSYLHQTIDFIGRNHCIHFL
ncbi:MAG: hypothetical protein RJA48_1503 [Verrucomicrobiota bacterium]